MLETLQGQVQTNAPFRQ